MMPNDPLAMEASMMVTKVMDAVRMIDWPAALHLMNGVDASQLDDDEVVMWAPMMAAAHELGRLSEIGDLCTGVAVLGKPTDTVEQATHLFSEEALVAFRETLAKCPPADSPVVTVQDFLEAPEGRTEPTADEIQMVGGDGFATIVETPLPEPDDPSDHSPCAAHVEAELDALKQGIEIFVEDMRRRFDCVDIDVLVTYSAHPRGAM